MAETKPPTHPELEKFGKTSLELVAVLANEIAGLKYAKKPAEHLANLGRAAHKLAVRFHQEAVVIADKEKPATINPLVQVTAINVAKGLEATARDLMAGQGIPKTWEDVADALKTHTKVVSAVQMLISQAGVSQTVVQPGEPLTGPDGKPLVEG